MSVASPPESFSLGIADQNLRPTQSLDLSPSPNLAIRLLFAIFYILDFPAFTYQLALDPTTGQWTGSQFISIMTLLAELFAIGVILASRDIRKLTWRCWPIVTLMVIAFLSFVWSQNPKETIGVAFRLSGTFLLGLALVGRMPHFQSIRFVVRTMTFGCALSIAWVYIFPDIAVHQATDVYQSVHAGLWRGIFSHKQGLGYFAGLTGGLLLFYRTRIFPLFLLAPALACAIIALVGTGSATGMITLGLTPAFFYAGYAVARAKPAARKAVLWRYLAILFTAGVAYEAGLLNFFIVQVLGKSTDLTGRADIWPITIANFNASGAALLGGGFGANFAVNLSEWSVDNGYIDKLIEFGYATSPVIFISYGAMLVASIKLLLKTPSNIAMTNIFPFGILMVILFVNISESNFMTKCFSTVLTAMAVGIIYEERNLPNGAGNPSRQTRAPQRGPFDQAPGGASGGNRWPSFSKPPGVA
jgi:hypothetical protein